MIEDPNKNRKKAAKKFSAMNKMNSWEMLRKSIKSQNSFIWDFLQRSLFDCISILSKRFHSNRLFSTEFKAHLGEYFRFYIKIIGSIQNWIVWNVRERMRLIIYSTKLPLAHSLHYQKHFGCVELPNCCNMFFLHPPKCYWIHLLSAIHFAHRFRCHWGRFVMAVLMGAGPWPSNCLPYY